MFVSCPGLPHCHMLLILDKEDKIKESEECDDVVCAEIPDPSDEILYSIVKSSMIHGPCGDFNPDSPCMDEIAGELACTKGFPKPFREFTNLNVNGYPEYRRRNGNTVTIKNEKFGNEWVVPYNPYLTRKFNAHCNVEVCSTVQSVKYIYKYLYKGYDCAMIKYSQATQQDEYTWDEIQAYLDTRYVGPVEAMWRIREYRMHDRSHAVIRLAVHLELQQNVVFREGEEQQALERSLQKGTTLTAWFKLNQVDINARTKYYTEIPYHYTFDGRSWKPRLSGKVLSRMYTVSPSDVERYCLRLLLLHVKGIILSSLILHCSVHSWK